MSYIPPGWTKQRHAAATVDDLSQLQYETLHLIPPISVSSPTAQDLLFGSRIVERTRLERQRMNLPAILSLHQPGVSPVDADPAVQAVAMQYAQQWLEQERARSFADPSAPLVLDASAGRAEEQKLRRDPIVQVVEDAGYEDFGFMVVRLDYSDEDAWARWCGTFDVPVDRGLAESMGGERIIDKLVLPLVEDAQLEGTGWHGVVSYYKDLRLNSMVQPGLNTSMVLVADMAVVNSLPFPTPGQESWIWAVDVDFGFQIGDQPPYSEPPTNRYPGYFRVVTSAAVTELWPLLKGSGAGGRDLWNPNVRVWAGVV